MMKTVSMKPRAQQTVTDPRWGAVVARDATADGTFCYSVRTTGVYCRPSCSARQPRPENVDFHNTATQAEAAGFRACRRCRPNDSSIDEQLTRTIARACRILEKSEQAIALEQLAQQVGLSPSYLHRNFKRITGLTPRDYAAARREETLRQNLAGAQTVTDAIYRAGYPSSSRFYENSHQLLGMKASQYRKGGASTSIGFAFGEGSLGSVLVAQSERGLCAIFLGEDRDKMVNELHERFPQAQQLSLDPTFSDTVAQVVSFIDRPASGLDLPLDIQGTAFQKRVWQALQSIPVGQKLSCSELAQKLGQPKAVRAVAAACAANKLAVAIPCHRIVGKDGSLTGYAWGLDRKQRLLEEEAKPIELL